jgi:hypothetical protein
MCAIELVSFDESGLALQRSSANERLWATDRGLAVLLTVRDTSPVFPASFGDELALWKAYRRIVPAEEQGLVELARVTASGRPALRFITKRVMDPSTGWGRTFLGILQIPFRDCSILIKAECSELSATGARETSVIHRLLGAGQLGFRPVPPEEASRIRGPADMEGWLVDPEDPTPAHLACNVSDDPRYDQEFAEHPLSLVRAFLDRTQSSIALAPPLGALPVYAGKARRWWQAW